MVSRIAACTSPRTGKLSKSACFMHYGRAGEVYSGAVGNESCRVGWNLEAGVGPVRCAVDSIPDFCRIWHCVRCADDPGRSARQLRHRPPLARAAKQRRGNPAWEKARQESRRRHDAFLPGAVRAVPSTRPGPDEPPEADEWPHQPSLRRAPENPPHIR
jgi:hypothetical protein